MKAKKTPKAAKAPKSAPFDPRLMEALKDPQACVEYLIHSVDGFDDDDFDAFFAALEDVCRAQGMNHVALRSEITRDALYKMFKSHNPKLQTFSRLLGSVGLGIALVPRDPAVKAAT